MLLSRVPPHASFETFPQATLAADYFQLKMLDAQKALLDETVAAYSKTLEIIRNRYAVGVAAKSDVVQAEAQTESVRAQSINLGVQRAQYEHAIAVLAGKAPAELTLPSGAARSAAAADTGEIAFRTAGKTP